MSKNDRLIRELITERRGLEHELAGLLTYLGGNHPDRSKANRERAKRRREIRRQMNVNGNAIISRAIKLFDPEVK